MTDLRLGDCLDVLSSLDECSVDAVVTDPPYGLEFMGKEWDGADGFRRSLNAADVGRDDVFGRTSARGPEYRSGHLFQHWCERWAAECLRVLKPGGHLVSFGGTRTYHRLAAGVEDAGFEIRDQLAWMFGSGFPKSLDVSKAIDARAGADRPVIGSFERQGRSGGILGTPTEIVRDITEPATAAAAAWDGWGTALKPGWEVIVWATKPSGEPDTIYKSLCLLGNRIASLSPVKYAEQTSGSSPAEQDAALLDSAQWSADERGSTRDALFAQMDTSQFESAIASSLNTVSSWRSILADLSSAANTSTTETRSETTTALRTLRSCLSGLTPLIIIRAASSQDGSRLDALPAARAFNAVAANLRSTRDLSALESAIAQGLISPQEEVAPGLSPIVLARKPLAGTVAANVMAYGTGALNIDGSRIGFVSEEDKAAAAAAAAAMRSTSDQNANRTAYGDFNNGAASLGPYLANMDKGRWPANVVLDEQAAEMLDAQTGESPPKAERNGTRGGSAWHGQEGFGSPDGEGRWPADPGGGASRFFYCAKVSSDERHQGLTTPSLFSGDAPDRNQHPTVKPIDLMRWLCKLVTPPGGLIVDPFLGSGTTGIAAALENFRFLGIEREADYMRIAQARISHWTTQPVEAA